jgi:2-C-methyl-D-erythritol 4-phosphate cytidylyltransferase
MNTCEKPVAVIVVAAGSGSRFASATNKILHPLAGKPMIVHALLAFVGRGDVREIILVANPAETGQLDDILAQAGLSDTVRVVAGGASRTESVNNALQTVDPQATLVAIHDGARPCITEGAIDAVFARAAQTGAAILASPIHGTIKRTDAKGNIVETIDRTGLAQAHTPQVFRRDWLGEAYAAPDETTDDAELVQRLGHTVAVVPDSPANIKITTPADLPLAEAILAARA